MLYTQVTPAGTHSQARPPSNCLCWQAKPCVVSIKCKAFRALFICIMPCYLGSAKFSFNLSHWSLRVSSLQSRSLLVYLHYKQQPPLPWLLPGVVLLRATIKATKYPSPKLQMDPCHPTMKCRYISQDPLWDLITINCIKNFRLNLTQSQRREIYVENVISSNISICKLAPFLKWK